MRLNDAPAPRSDAGVRAYTIFCLTALMGVVLALMENDRDLLWVLLLAAVGAVGVVAHWRIGPPLVLLGLATLEVFHLQNRPWYARPPAWEESPFMDAVLAASLLAYTAGHYRLLSLTQAVFPVDIRRRPTKGARGQGPGVRDQRSEVRGQRFGARSDISSIPDPWPLTSDPSPRRSGEALGSWELPVLAISAGVWAVGVSLFWLVLSSVEPPLDMTRGLWRGLLLIFLAGLTAAVLGGAAAYLGWSAAPAEEHQMCLQDMAWRETRREQNRINRFLTWARLRAQRRREQS